jgi:hypothetical protein
MAAFTQAQLQVEAKPSGLTLVDSVGVADSKLSW